jgi:transcriptional regulator with XRE-family HTH domain
MWALPCPIADVGYGQLLWHQAAYGAFCVAIEVRQEDAESLVTMPDALSTLSTAEVVCQTTSAVYTSGACSVDNDSAGRELTATSMIFMAYKVSCLLQSLRRQWALTQEELGRLLGNFEAKYVSALESERLEPNAHVLFGLEIIFGQHAREIFVKLFDEAEEEVIRNLYIFNEELANDSSPEAPRKRQLASEALTRAVMQANPPGYEPG